MFLRSWWAWMNAAPHVSMPKVNQAMLDMSQPLPHNRAHNTMLLEHWRMHENLAEAQKSMLSIRMLVLGPDIINTADGMLYAETRAEANRLRDSILDMMGVN